ncbi:hypothetical protein MZH72_18500, partial [Escherichia coli]|nr:hypothetical protein [Escherichia coli]
NKTGPQSIHILRGVRQQQDEPGRFSICSRQAAVVLNKTGPQSIHILRGVRQQQDEPGRFSICSRQAAVVQCLFNEQTGLATRL